MRTRGFAAALALGVALAAAAGCSTGRDAVDPSNGGDNGFVATQKTVAIYPAAHRATAPAVSGTLLDGSPFNLAGDRGHVVVMNFWGSWCAPCRSEAETLQGVHAATAPQGVEFVGVNIRDEKDTATAYESAHGLTYPSIYDPSGRVALAFAHVPPTAIPSTIVIDKTGRIAALRLGSVTTAQLTSMIAAAS